MSSNGTGGEDVEIRPNVQSEGCSPVLTEISTLHKLLTRIQSIAGRLSPPDRAPGLRHLSTLQRR